MGEMRRFGAKHDFTAALDAGHCFHLDYCLPGFTLVCLCASSMGMGAI
jgi:hypothetical protein